MTPVFARAFSSSRSQRAATAPAILSGLTSATLLPSFSNARPMSPLRLASTASFSAGSRWRMISSMVAVCIPAAWSWANGLPASTASSCLASPTSTTRGMRSAPAMLQQVARLHGGGKRALVDHQHRLREGGAHLPGALLREPAFGHAGIAREEHLEGFRRNAGLRSQRPSRRGRGREPGHAPALLLRRASVARFSIVVFPVPA